MPRSIGLTALSRHIAADVRAVRRDEAVRIVAAVAAKAIESGDRDGVFRKLSHGQLGDEQLLVSHGRAANLVAYSAEFVDLLHSSLHNSVTVPPEPWLDLRFELRFFDDPADAESPWTYVLLGTECAALEERWQGIDGVERFSIPDPDDMTRLDDDDGLAARAETWARITAPFANSGPISWRLPDPELLFDIFDSLADPDRDSVRAEEGEITVALVAAAVKRLLDISEREAEDLLTAKESTAVAPY